MRCDIPCWFSLSLCSVRNEQLVRKFLKIIKNTMSGAYDETKLLKTSVKIHWTGINVYLPQKKVFAFHGHWVNTEFPKHEISGSVAPGIGKRLGLGDNKDDNKSVFLFHIFLLRFNFYISVGLQPFLISACSGTQKWKGSENLVIPFI